MRTFTGILIVIIIFLTGCSNKLSLELISAKIDIRDDRTGIGITSGEMEGKFIKPISLSYDFVLKNNSTETLGGAEEPNSQTYTYDDGIKLIIEPKENLIATIQEIIGFNIFTEEGRVQAFLGMSETGTPILEPNQEGKYTFDFELGVPEGNPEMRIAPTQEQLDKLVRNAMEATLVIYIGEKEMARFDLNN